MLGPFAALLKALPRGGSGRGLALPSAEPCLQLPAGRRRAGCSGGTRCSLVPCGCAEQSFTEPLLLCVFARALPCSKYEALFALCPVLSSPVLPIVPVSGTFWVGGKAMRNSELSWCRNRVAAWKQPGLSDALLSRGNGCARISHAKFQPV